MAGAPPLGPVQLVARDVAQVGMKEDRVGRQLQVEAGRGVEAADGRDLARHDRSLGLPARGGRYRRRILGRSIGPSLGKLENLQKRESGGFRQLDRIQ